MDIVIERGVESDDSTDTFEQTEYSCDSYRIDSGCLIMKNVRVKDGSYFPTIIHPLVNIGRIVVGNSESSGAIYR